MLFIAALEVLNNSIRANEGIKGLKVKGQEYKLLAFADDPTILLEDPPEGYNILESELKDYSDVAGMKINIDKTKMIAKKLTKNQEKELENTSGIQIATKVKYLGINFTKRMSSLHEDNYGKILRD